jgi:formamidopyrimidine-DNA glycosylase
MPELPEVETVARQLAPRLKGRTVRSLRIFDPLLRTQTAPRLKGRKIAAVRRSGKQVLFEFAPASHSGAPLWLAVHLRMTGRLIWAPNAAAEAKEDRLRARFALDRGALLFADTRRFGTFRWFKDERETRPAGVDPLSAAMTVERLGQMAGKARQNMKAFLLRQDRIVGVGNIYASEILHDARISPRRHATALRPIEISRLHGSTQKILRRAIENCGTTFSDFQDAHGMSGSYQQYLGVYDREDEACDRCGKKIRRIVQQQRSTYYCGGCQR